MAADQSATSPRPRKERTENAAMRRRQVIEATMRSIVKNGLGGTTLATVSAEAGLSQGVAVFYFKNKQTLLGEVLRHQYQVYMDNWQAAREAAGPDPADQLIALVKTDFDPGICDAESLVIWHAFWGEASARPLFAEISTTFDAERTRAMRDVCAALLAASGRPADDAAELGAAIDALTDGLWLRIYLSTEGLNTGRAAKITAKFVAQMFPEHAERLLRGIGG